MKIARKDVHLIRVPFDTQPTAKCYSRGAAFRGR